jgi:hypothetical protein
MGKSTVIVNIFLQDIKAGQGAALIDIHGDLVHQAIEIIPPEHYPRCIFFDPGDPEGIPLWNPLALTTDCIIHRQANNLVASFKRVFTGWGDRLEHVLRNGNIGLSFIPEPSTLLDLYSLVRQGGKENERLREAIIASTADGPVRQFWAEDFKKDYRKSDLQAPRHKLSKLVSAGTVSLMLSQSQNRIDFRRIMNQGQILLVDLSSIGGEVAEILGNFMLTLMLATALGRNKTPEANSPTRTSNMTKSSRKTENLLDSITEKIITGSQNPEEDARIDQVTAEYTASISQPQIYRPKHPTRNVDSRNQEYGNYE